MPKLIIESRKAHISPEMAVNRILPHYMQRMVGPFIFMDHAGPVNINPAALSDLDVLPHPHIGLSTVSYLFGGKVTHRDSLGVEQIILPGEVNWMTAGRGIAHSERFEDPAALAGGGLEMIQTWVALPEEHEETAPAFTNYKQEELPVFSDRGVWYRLIAGEAFGVKSNVVTHSPLIYLHVVLEAGSGFSLPDSVPERGIYVAKGSLEIDHQVYKAGQLVVFLPEENPGIKAREKCTLMVLGGETLGKRHIWWNFVSSRKERIEQAKADWTEGRIILPPNDNDEFIPLPPDRRSSEESGPRPEALS